ncbi:hypothetical protein C8F01DRAFT_1368541 [Mycena amicta]|nr:hypothetical protein C8F01DRAFT_1368541 [Mycena amicta]
MPLRPSLPPPLPTSPSTYTKPLTPSVPPAQGSSRIPVVEELASDSPITRLSLDLDSISAGLASALATSVVAHVLFLKNQVPFPIMQLYRLPNGKSTPRAVKLRTELLASFDTLSSHLDTTFTALSTAIALCRRNQNRNQDNNTNATTTGRAQLAILVGPSIGAAKTKVMFVVDGLATKVWGERDDSESDAEESGSGSDSESDEEEDTSSDDEGSEPPESDSESEEEQSDSEHPPPSPLPTTPIPPRTKNLPLSPRQTPTSSRGPHAAKRTESEADAQQLIRTATRQLSHAMATADSLSDELASTQTHILLRAPRRFKHPAWIPRQTAGGAMDRAVEAFWQETRTRADAGNGKKRGQKKVEGVWIACRADVEPERTRIEDEDEDDEMIWWSWDGKLVGLSEW